MLDLRFIRANLDAVKHMLKNRRNDLDISVFEAIDKKRRENPSYPSNPFATAKTR